MGALALAALLLGLSPGVHASAALIAPAAAAFVAWTLWGSRPARRAVVAGAAGLTLGLAAYLAAFLVIDLHHPPSSFVRVALSPSRSLWGLSAGDLDSPLERFWLTVSGRQWQDAMHPGDPSRLLTGLAEYGRRLASVEFPLPFLACAV